MSYKALLFCPDERTAKTVTQVLSELEFHVEACNEPFAAVKQLMAGHFDAVVVDCDNEQNATLLFKSARNSEFNQASLSVAVVEGQTGVAKAFRIGANLVLTKPINVEQSKGTLRVARGLLRKNEATKASTKPAETAPRFVPSPSAPAATPKPAFLTHAAPLTPAVTASSSSAFELEKDPAPAPEPAEAAFLESMPDPANKIHVEATAAKASPWQPLPKPAAQPMAEKMTAALKHAAEATGRADSGISVGSGAAAAPARAPEVDAEISALDETLELPVSTVSATPASTKSSTNWGRIAAIVLVAAAGAAIYRAGTVTHWQMPSLSTLRSNTSSPVPQSVKPAPPAVTPATSAQLATTSPVNGAPNSAAANAIPQKPSPATAVSLPNPVKPTVTASSFDPQPSVVKSIDDNSANTIRVDTQKPKPAAPKPVTAESVEPAAPDAISADSSSGDQAISNLVSMPSDIPQPAPGTLRVSQGVSQGLLVKKVPPVYPQRALKARIQGSVQLLATISKNGDIADVTLLAGESLLGQAAIDAVKQWKFKPYLLDGQPMEIQTQITVNFKLP